MCKMIYKDKIVLRPEQHCRTIGKQKQKQKKKLQKQKTKTKTTKTKTKTCSILASLYLRVQCLCIERL